MIPAELKERTKAIALRVIRAVNTAEMRDVRWGTLQSGLPGQIKRGLREQEG